MRLVDQRSCRGGGCLKDTLPIDSGAEYDGVQTYLVALLCLAKTGPGECASRRRTATATSKSVPYALDDRYGHAPRIRAKRVKPPVVQQLKASRTRTFPS
jgi:hypothetical protein